MIYYTCTSSTTKDFHRIKFVETYRQAHYFLTSKSEIEV
jgi:hypothetical protein